MLLKFFLQGKKPPVLKKYGGHYAVSRSLIEGLQKIKVDFNYNPSKKKEIAENVIVLAGVEQLKEAIRLKKKAKIKKLFAGPNICDSATEEDGILASKEVDVCIVNSPWTLKIFEEEKTDLKDRISIWYAGVDTDYWQPSYRQKQGDVVVYWKSNDETFCSEIEKIISSNNYNPVRIKYGSYTKEQYKEVLDRAEFAVFVSKRESQGIALTEAWSMDVPTYVWDIHEMIYRNGKPIETTACPYLTSETGLRWSNLDELKEIVHQTQNKTFSFEPRKYTLQMFSDERSAAILVEKFQTFS